MFEVVSQLLIYQRVRRCANLFWSDLAEEFAGILLSHLPFLEGCLQLLA
jgi:hypothetical protein